MVLAPLCGEGNGTPLQYSCLENPMGGGAWWAAVHGVAKNQSRLSGFTFTFHFHALEKDMATHPSVLAWRIPGTGEPGGLPSLGSHRVGHDWSDLAAAAAVPLQDLGLIPGLGRSPGGGHGNPLGYSCLENPYEQRSLVGSSPWGGRVRHERVTWHTQHTAPLLHYSGQCRQQKRVDGPLTLTLPALASRSSE